MAETKRKKLEVLKSQLSNERATFLPQWRDLGDNFLPRRVRFNQSDVNKGDRRNQKIIDSTPTMCARTLRAGMMSGITSPARPWFKLTTPDPDLAEFGRVKQYLHDVNLRMTAAFLKSNYYNVKPIVYGDLGVFATGAYSMEEDMESVIRCQSFAVGSYMIAKDHRGMVNTFMRDFRMTVRQLVEKFGRYDENSGKPMWEVFSDEVKNLWDRSEYETWIDVVHCIKPNDEYNPKAFHSKYKRFESCYYEVNNTANSQDRYLREKGYDYFPILVPRWEVTGEDVFGTECPGMIATGDAKQLQHGERQIARAIDKMINPPMLAPTHMKTQKSSVLPGDITYADIRQDMHGFRPVHEIDPRVTELENKQAQIRSRIEKAFYTDLFLMLAESDRRQITAREIDERKEEKLLALGPVLEQLNDDDNDPAIDILYNNMNIQRKLPPPPEELQGVQMKVEYVSIMAQAQKLVGLNGQERFLGFYGQVLALDPSARHKVNTDQMIDDYADGCGMSPKVVRSDEDAQASRGQEAQAAAAQQKMEAISQGAGAAKDLSQADTSGENALTGLMSSMNQGGQ